MKEYFIINENIKSGPFNLNKIKQEYLFNDTLVWHEGLDNWVLASEIKELKNLINDKSIKDSKNIFLIDNNNKIGPLNFQDLKKYNIEPNTMIWFENLSDWIPAHKIDELKNSLIFEKKTPKTRNKTSNKIESAPIFITKSNKSFRYVCFQNSLRTSLVYFIIALSFLLYSGVDFFKTLKVISLIFILSNFLSIFYKNLNLARYLSSIFFIVGVITLINQQTQIDILKENILKKELSYSNFKKDKILLTKKSASSQIPKILLNSSVLSVKNFYFLKSGTHFYEIFDNDTIEYISRSPIALKFEKTNTSLYETVYLLVDSANENKSKKVIINRNDISIDNFLSKVEIKISEDNIETYKDEQTLFIERVLFEKFKNEQIYIDSKSDIYQILSKYKSRYQSPDFYKIKKTVKKTQPQFKKFNSKFKSITVNKNTLLTGEPNLNSKTLYVIKPGEEITILSYNLFNNYYLKVKVNEGVKNSHIGYVNINSFVELSSLNISKNETKDVKVDNSKIIINKILTINFESIILQIDEMKDGSFKYSSFKKSTLSPKKPFLEIFNGKRTFTKNGSLFEFKNGEDTYFIDEKIRRNRSGKYKLRIFKNSKLILKQNSEN